MIVKLLKNSLRIFKADLSKICKNWVSLVVIGGLILLPSLYAWINIYASWDPYGNTKGIKVGIVNEDQGGHIKDSAVNIGEEVISSLKENESLGWVFYDNREEGLAEVDKGSVYATLIIPEDFSKKILTLVEAEPVKPQLEYYVNEKINAIAPKITDKGATTIQNQITTSFIETVANKLIEVMHSVGIEIDKEYPTIEKLEDMMVRLQDKFPDLESSLDMLAEKASNGKVVIERQDKNVVALQKILNQLIDFNSDITTSLEELSKKPEEVIPELKENLVLIQTIFTDISTSTAELKDSIELNKPVLINDIDTGIVKLESAKNRLTELADKAGELDKDLSSTIKSTKNELINIMDEYISSFEELKTKLDNTDTALSILNRLENLSKTAASDVKSLRKNIESVSKKIDLQLAILQSIVSKVEGIKPPSIPSVPTPMPPSEETPVAPGEDSNGSEDIVETPENPPSDLPTDIPEDDSTHTSSAVATRSVNTSSTGDVAFVAEITETLEIVNEAKQELSTNTEVFGDAIYALNDMQADLITLKGLSNNVTASTQALNSLKATSRSLSSTIRSIRTLIEMRTSSISDKLTTLEEIMAETATGVNSLKRTVTNVATGGQEKIDSIVANIEKVQDKLTDVSNRVVNTVHSEADRVQTKVEDVKLSLSELQNRLNSLSGKLEDKVVLEETLGNISQLTYNIGASLDSTINLLDSDLIAKLKEKISQMSTFVGDVSGLLGNVQNELEYLRDFGTRLGEKSELLAEDILAVKEHIPVLRENVDKVVDKINLLNENVDVKDLINQLTMDNSDKSEFLATPVNLNTHILYPMANYGAGMTPFYTTLCLWVGALLLCALLTTKSKNVSFKCTPVEEYFGKYLLFATCAMLQGFIAALGDIVVLGVEVKQPVLFVCLAMMYSAIFMAIVYTLVSLFGNVGKAIGVVLLVLQLAGSGGTFPIQVTPVFFQKIHEFLPFTYGISAMREAIAGVYYETLIKDIVTLCIFFVVFICLGVLLKKKANAILHRFSKKLGESGVIEH